jgi:hypothetical protein
MPFRPSDDFQKWQTAYTREDAYRDSEARQERLFLITYLPLLVALLYGIFVGVRSILAPVSDLPAWLGGAGGLLFWSSLAC